MIKTQELPAIPILLNHEPGAVLGSAEATPRGLEIRLRDDLMLSDSQVIGTFGNVAYEVLERAASGAIRRLRIREFSLAASDPPEVTKLIDTAGGWIPADETVPTHIYSVLIHVVGGRQHHGEDYVEIGIYNPRTDRWQHNVGDEDLELEREHVSHWQPLPAKP